MLGCIRMAIDNIAEKCQRLHTTPVESMDMDSKLKIIQVGTVVTLLLVVSLWLSHSSFWGLSAQGPASYFHRLWHNTQESAENLKKKEKLYKENCSAYLAYYMYWYPWNWSGKWAKRAPEAQQEAVENNIYSELQCQSSPHWGERISKNSSRYTWRIEETWVLSGGVYSMSVWVGGCVPQLIPCTLSLYQIKFSRIFKSVS